MDKALDQSKPNEFPSFETLIYDSVESISVALIALIAVYTAYFIQRNVMKNDWAKKQGEIYTDWWANKDAKRIRKAIISDEAYSEIVPALQRRINKETGGVVGPDDYDIIEAVDQFLSLLTRFREFDSQHMGYARRDLWVRVFGHWIEKINTREELQTYIEDFWEDVDLLRPPNFSWSEKSRNWFRRMFGSMKISK